MTRLLRRSSLSGFAFAALCAAGLAVVASAPAYAQRSAAMGHAAGGPHFAPSMRMGGVPASHRSQHLTYLAPFRNGRTAARSSLHASNSFASNRHIVLPTRDGRDRFRFHHAFGFPSDNFFFPYFAYGYWPWWWGWDSDNGNDCRHYNNGYEACDAAPGVESPEASSIDSADDTQRPMIVVYLRDGSGYGALDYWVSNGELHLITTYGAQKTFPMEEVDLERTGKENAQQGLNFVFHTTPMVSDPGASLAPDSYAPACPAVSSAAQPAKAAEAVSSAVGTGQTAFGAAGSPSEKGFAVSSVRMGSPAAEAGLQAGDVVIRVGCQPVRNTQELESALAGSEGSVWVSYLIQGSWLTDKKIVRWLSSPHP